MKMFLSNQTIALAVLMGGIALAQTQDRIYGPGAPPLPAGGNIAVAGYEGVGPGGAVKSFRFISHEFGFEGKVVKGAPYTADAVTETTQTLADGNRITHKTTSSIARDSEGRTRREETLGAIGPWSSEGEPGKMVVINDPVAKTNYVLEPFGHTVRKTSTTAQVTQVKKEMDEALASHVISDKGLSKKEVDEVFFKQTKAPAGPEDLGTTKTESLGQQTMEGLVVDGKRTTMTIPAGRIGNERPLDIVSEDWYSNELQTIVMSKHSDPQSGDMVYKLTNVQRAEPSATLFEPPAGSVVTEGEPGRPMILKMTGDKK